MDANENLAVLNQQQDIFGNVHTRYQQQYRGLPLWGQHITLHERNNQVYRARGKIARGLAQDLEPQISNSTTKLVSTAGKYIDQALGWVSETTGVPTADWNLTNVSSQRQIYVHNGKAEIVQVVSFLAESIAQEPVRPTVIIQENSDQILKAWNGLAHVDASGPGGNVKIGRYDYGTDYGFLDVTETPSGCAMINAKVYTVDLQNSMDNSATTPFEFPCYENTTREINGAYSPLNDAHYNGGVVFDMYQEWFGLPPLTFQLALKVHFGSGYDNAYWNGTSMVFGDGGSMFYPLVDLNIVSHEVSHGFTEQNSNLVYNGQSGGINEAFSDIAGEAAEYYSNGSVDWLIGAAITKNMTALRYFENPALDGFSIGHADNYFNGIDVHFSSGVFNRAYYLIANSEGWSPRKAFEIFVHANRFYWGPLTQFESGACGVLSATDDLGYDKKIVIGAFANVGVYCLSDSLDSDADGMTDSWEWKWQLNPDDPADAWLDLDGDGVNNVTEFQYQSNPTLSDSDGDALTDSDEIFSHGTSPILADTDMDEMRDDFEVQYGLDPLDPADAELDLDGDGSSNLDEYLNGTDPSDPNDYFIELDFYFESFEEELNRNWETSSNSTDGGWAASTEWAAHGATSFAATGLSRNERATLRFSAFFKEGLITFTYSTSFSNCCDAFIIYVDGKQLLTINEQNSDMVAIEFSNPGQYDIEFVYQKSNYSSTDTDGVWIDALFFESDNDDVDADGIDNFWEIYFGLDPEDPADATQDLDQDGATNLQEHQYSSNPTLPDTDGDTLSDGDEINLYGTLPNREDSDEDEIDDAYEVDNGLNALDPSDAALDLDGDGSSNLDEYLNGTDPNDAEDYYQPLEFAYFSFEEDTLPPGWKVTSTGANQWQPSQEWSALGNQSLSASDLTAGDTATLSYSDDFSSGTFSFEYRYRFNPSNCCRELRIYVDGNLTRTFSGFGEISGRFSLPLSAGEHTIDIQLYDSSNSGSDNIAWIDFAVFESSSDDVDNDGMSNIWEIRHDLDPENPNDRDLDADSDGLSNFTEFKNSTNPQLIDSDGDTLSDADEVVYGTLGNVADTDGDSMTDGFEIQYGLEPTNPTDGLLDLDNDGLTNKAEFVLNSDPSNPGSVVQPLTLLTESFESGISPRLKLTFSEYATPWQTTSSWSSQGEQSLAMIDGIYYSTSTVELTELFPAGTLHFDYQVTFISDSYLGIYLDGNLLARPNSSTNTYTINLSAGVHTIKWVARSGYFSGGDAFLDNIRFFVNDTNDYDSDGIPDRWEWEQGLNPKDPADSALDPDEDGATNLQEFENNTNPALSDSDGDTLSDGDEINLYGSNPLLGDSDEDDLGDAYEVRYGLNPNDPTDADLDLDGDGYTNMEEFLSGTDPSDSDDYVIPVSFMALTFEDDTLPEGWEITSSDFIRWKYATDWSSQGERSLAVRYMTNYKSSTSLLYRGWTEAGTLSLDFRARLLPVCCSYFKVYIDGEEQYSRSSFSDIESTLQFDISAGLHSIEIQLLHDAITLNQSIVWVDKIWFESSETDVDLDGMPNRWELEHNLDPEQAYDAEVDTDGDQLTNLEEFVNNTNPRRRDTDDDGAEDALELQANTLPNDADSDGDNMKDGYELNYGLDPLSPEDAMLDNDDDGLSNLEEFRLQLNPNNALSVISPIFLWEDSFENGASPMWSFTNQRAVDWAVSSKWYSDGNFSLSTPNMPYYSSAQAEITGLFTAGTFSFDYRVSYDSTSCVLALFLDDVPTAYYYYNSSRSDTLDLPAGVHTIKFSANANHNNGYCSISIDNVRFAIAGDGDPDSDGMPSAWETEHGFNPMDPTDAEGDPDFDGLTNVQEYEANTDPNVANIDLQVTMSKLVDNDSSEVNYRVRITNIGITDATDIQLINRNESALNMLYTLADDSVMSCSGNGDRIECYIPYLAATAQESIDFKVAVEDSIAHNFYSTAYAAQNDYDESNNEKLSAYTGGALHWVMLAMLSALYWARRRSGVKP